MKVTARTCKVSAPPQQLSLSSHVRSLWITTRHLAQTARVYPLFFAFLGRHYSIVKLPSKEDYQSAAAPSSRTDSSLTGEVSPKGTALARWCARADIYLSPYAEALRAPAIIRSIDIGPDQWG